MVEDQPCPSLTSSQASVHHEGGEDNAPNMVGGADGAEEEGAAAPRQPRPKKEARKIPRYESASIDEEEFQDCKYTGAFRSNRPRLQLNLFLTINPTCSIMDRLFEYDHLNCSICSLLLEMIVFK